MRIVLTYLLPIVLFLAWRDFSMCNLTVAFVMVYSLYEIGYIENDCETTKWEMNPTMRVSSEALAFYNDKKISIYSFKMLTAVVAGVYLVKWGVSIGYILFPLLLIPTYLAYNRLRCKWNLILHAVLMFIRYYAPILLATRVFVWADALAILFVYPIKDIVELSVKGKFGGYQNRFVKKYILHDHSLFQVYRLKYYTITTLIAVVMYLMGLIDVSTLIIYIYFLAFTFISKNVVS